MKRLLILALFAFAGWYGWKHYAELRGQGSNDCELVNHSGQDLQRLRVSVGGQTVVSETLAENATVHLPFRSDQDGTFEVVWKPTKTDAEYRWRGGTFTHGPVLTRHTFEFTGGTDVIWTS